MNETGKELQMKMLIKTQQLSKPNEIIDFIAKDNKEGLDDYFTKQTTPFYVR